MLDEIAKLQTEIVKALPGRADQTTKGAMLRAAKALESLRHYLALENLDRLGGGRLTDDEGAPAAAPAAAKGGAK